MTSSSVHTAANPNRSRPLSPPRRRPARARRPSRRAGGRLGRRAGRAADVGRSLPAAGAEAGPRGGGIVRLIAVPPGRNEFGVGVGVRRWVRASLWTCSWSFGCTVVCLRRRVRGVRRLGVRSDASAPSLRVDVLRRRACRLGRLRLGCRRRRRDGDRDVARRPPGCPAPAPAVGADLAGKPDCRPAPCRARPRRRRGWPARRWPAGRSAAAPAGRPRSGPARRCRAAAPRWRPRRCSARAARTSRRRAGRARSSANGARRARGACFGAERSASCRLPDAFGGAQPHRRRSRVGRDLVLGGRLAAPGEQPQLRATVGERNRQLDRRAVGCASAARPA